MRHYSNIQAMRGVAAMMVLLVHSIAIPDVFALTWAVPYLSKWGGAGVDLFFVISGFIIAMVASGLGASSVPGNDVATARGFAIKRLIRIYPIYWVVLAIAIFLSPYVHLAPASLPDRPFWKMFFLLEPFNNKVMASWSLVFEMYFYVVVTAILLIAPRRFYAAMAVWAVISLGLIAYDTAMGSPMTWVPPFSPVLIEFMLGVLIAYAVGRGITVNPKIWVALGIVLFIIGAEINARYGYWSHWNRTLCFGVPAAMVIYGVVSAEIRGLWFASKPLQALGDASYSIYIWHQLLFACLFEIYLRLGLMNLWPVLVVLSWIVIVVALGLASFHFLERPLLRFFGGLLLGSSGRRQGEPSRRGGLAFAAVVCLVVLAMPIASGAFSAQRAAAFAQQGSVWPNEADKPAIAFSGDETLSQPSSIALPANGGTANTISMQVNSTAEGALYVGYQVNGVTHDRWYGFGAGEQTILLAVPVDMDGGTVWIAKDPAQVDMKVSRITAQMR